MFDEKRFNLFLFLFFIALMIPAYWNPLFETTGARYGEISREMLASGNYMEPFYNGIKHFHKPPFTYWINALGLAVFGVNGFGARFFGAVASIIILIYTRKTAFVLTEDREKADASVLILASSILFMVVSRIVATDIYLVMFTIMLQYHLFSHIYIKQRTSHALLIGLYAGLGFMTKGPVIFLFTLLPFFIAKIFDRKHRGVFSLKQIFVILAVFAVVALPWYGYVVSINDGLLEYFLYDQTVERVATDRFNRSKEFYFFFMIFFGTFVPWAFFMLRNYRRTGELKTGWVLYLYILVPFIVFQISTSKLGTYLLPFYPVAAVIAALNTDSRLLRMFSFVLLMLASLALAVIPFIVDYVQPYWYICIPVGIFFVLLTLYTYKTYYKKHFVASFAFIIIAITFSVYCVIPLIGPHMKGYRLITQDIKNFDPEGKYQVLLYKTFAPSVSFYMNELVPMALSRTRETQFQKKEDYADVYIDNIDELQEYLKKHQEVILVTRKKFLYRNFMDVTGYKCSIIDVLGTKKYISFCQSPSIYKQP
ncbi:glycosyl transferase family 39 [Denitrovibrio acetiphilus DSM 12809]|uniref:Glycosyl transferase family 39 n=1 Tax=Denitrovibrio acetiphilus (strain DSM 12809 / NBRC 114555 / N2460) TaxID=522772 RepID=D4H0X9_DENA2|nr:glycosyltransferase family 39 protein [Denitrovibrio acetiphilus]ADD68642.1 glycosyl transferase family 39 [Denitrovibrio acetiphilus DSM 12809]